MTHKITVRLFLLFVTTFTVPQTLLAALDITKDAVISITDNASSWFGSYGNLYLNALSYSQDNLITYNGWQYATYYDANRNVAVARRQLPDGAWESLSLTDYRQTTNDTHNNISMGISTDGRIHLSFDHHGNDLNYRMSVADLANDPESFTWNASQFQSIRDDFGQGTITAVTYPRFMLSGSGVFLFAIRRGSSGDGDSYIYRYNDDGSWTTLGQFVEGGGENAYFHGMTFSGDRLHVTWCWRATSNGTTNHDLLYAYSDDFGVTWKNNDGESLSNTGDDPIHLRDDGYRVYNINQGTNLINQEGMIVDEQGRVHVISREDVNGVNRQMHYYRDLQGDWHRINTGIATIDWDNRSKIAYDTTGNVYAIMPNISIAAASVNSGYNDWTVISDEDAGVYYHTEPLIDRMALLRNDNRLFVFAQRGGRNSGSRRIDVIEYTLNTGGVGLGPPGYQLCAQEGETITFDEPTDVAYGTDGNYAYQEGVTGNITFDNDTFGDPANGEDKFGYCRATVGVKPGIGKDFIPRVYVSHRQLTVQWSNLASHSTFAEGSTSHLGRARVIITDLKGRVAFSDEVAADFVTIPLNRLTPGVHLVTIEYGDESWSQKIAVMGR